MKIVFMGTPEFSVPILKALEKHHDILLVVTQPDRPVGRKRKLTPPSVKVEAMRLGLDVFQPENLKKDYQEILDKNPDLIITSAYGQMLPNQLIDNIKSINIHASLLPKYRGGAPIQYAIMNGDKKTGITIMEMVEKMDAGDIYFQKEIPIEISDTTTTLTSKLSLLGAGMIIEFLKDINKFKKTKQDLDKVTFAYNIKYEDQIIDFNKPSRLVLAHIRAMQDEPGAICDEFDSILKIHKAIPTDYNFKAKPGEFEFQKKKIYAKTLDGAIEIIKLQPAGKKVLRAIDFLNGRMYKKL